MLDGRQMMKQMLDLNKATFLNAYETTCLFQEQAEKVSNIMMDQSGWIPKEKKKVFNECVSVFKDGFEEWKECVNENFDTVENLMEANFVAPEESKQADKPSPAPTKGGKPEPKKK